ncbi:unnamed protein product [Psylliodes chrysocephalus]|uniref:Peptidase A2 domain-containing protein n=1 Tax=Psylliodes chrysocephalus TaxID=3402493 RepID=A0A9P0CUK2_9CUCU|nr:unnamed protein product [Psylliodes chrysocephala]
MNGLNFIKVDYCNKELRFVIDTGASLSVIFSRCVRDESDINKNRTVKIQGISGSAYTAGTCNVNLDLHNGYELNHEFSSEIDGVIGRDIFIKYKANINYEHFFLSLVIKDAKIEIPLYADYDE